MPKRYNLLIQTGGELTLTVTEESSLKKLVRPTTMFIPVKHTYAFILALRVRIKRDTFIICKAGKSYNSEIHCRTWRNLSISESKFSTVVCCSITWRKEHENPLSPISVGFMKFVDVLSLMIPPFLLLKGNVLILKKKKEIKL